MGFGMQPDRAALGGVLARVLQKIGDHALDLRRIERKRRQLVVRQKIERKTAFMKTIGPETADFGKAGVHVAFHKQHAQLTRLEDGKSQEVLNEVLQALSAGEHISHDLALAIIERPELLALQQLDVSVQNRQGRFQIVGGGAQRVGGFAETVAQLFEFASDFERGAGSGSLRARVWRGAFLHRTGASKRHGWCFLRRRGHLDPKKDSQGRLMDYLL